MEIKKHKKLMYWLVFVLSILIVSAVTYEIDITTDEKTETYLISESISTGLNKESILKNKIDELLIEDINKDLLKRYADAHISCHRFGDECMEAFISLVNTME